MKTVAKLAGVSVQTVSNLVNGRVHLMSEQTRERVQQAMLSVEYFPQGAARTLRSGRTRTLGFLVLDEHARFLADPLTDLMLGGAGDVARDHGYGLLIQGERPSVRSEALLAPLLERRVDGAFVLLSGEPATRSWYIQRLDAIGTPYVVFDEPIEEGTGVAVTAMNREGAHRLTRYLVDRGHRRIGFIGARVPWAVVEERHRGYREALQDAGIKVDEELELFEGGIDPSGGRAMGRKLLQRSQPPTAIMATSDLLAAGVLVAAREIGLAIPDDIAITGFDDFIFAAFMDPPLTTVRVPGHEMGAIAAEMLIRRLDTPDSAFERAVLPVELSIRSSA